MTWEDTFESCQGKGTTRFLRRPVPEVCGAGVLRTPRHTSAGFQPARVGATTMPAAKQTPRGLVNI
jgi:hypothetical protein